MITYFLILRHKPIMRPGGVGWTGAWKAFAGQAKPFFVLRRAELLPQIKRSLSSAKDMVDF